MTVQSVDRFAQLVAWYAAQNPPGQSALAYRSRTYVTAYTQMLVNLRTRRLLNSELPALQLNVDDTNNWTAGFLQAWAKVVDVLTFYQERIANEGFLRTATERKSITELLRSIDYELRPSIAASTYLAFGVRDGADSATRRVTIPIGTAVQSVPTQGQASSASPAARQANQLPQVFETTDAFEARSDWNALTPLKRAGRSWRDIRLTSTPLRAAGVKTGLKRGDEILIVGHTPDAAAPPWWLATVTSVEAQSNRGCTLITYERTAANSPDPIIVEPSVYAVRQTASLRTYDQGSVHYTSAADAKWQPSSIGLPNTAGRTLLQTDSGVLYVGTDKGVYRSTDQGRTWADINSGLMHAKVYALTMDASGQLYAGTDKGTLFVSRDQGNSWNRVVFQYPRGLAALFRLPGQAPLGPLPKAAIRQLSTCIMNGRNYLIAATDDGVFVSDNQGVAWRKANLSTWGSTAKPNIGWTLASAPNRWQNLAGTDLGVFPIDVTAALKLTRAYLAGFIGVLLGALLFFWAGRDTFVDPEIARVPWQILVLVAVIIATILIALTVFRRWQNRLDPLGVPVRALLTHADNTLWAGTANGVYRWNDRTRKWQAIHDGMLTELFTLDASDQADALNTGIFPDSLRQAFVEHEIELSGAITVTIDKPDERWTVTDQQTSRAYPLQLDETLLIAYQPFDVRALAFDVRGVLYAGTSIDRVFCSQTQGDNWHDFSHELGLVEVVGFAFDIDNNVLAAGTPPDDKPDQRWQRLKIEGRQIDLDKAYAVDAPSWLILRQADRASLYAVVEASAIPGKDGRKIGSYTSLRVDRSELLDAFDRRDTLALIQTESLVPFDAEPLTGTAIAFDTYVPDLEAGHILLISGQRMRLRLADDLPKQLSLSSADGLRHQPVAAGDVLQVLAAPVELGSGRTRWRLLDRDRFDGTLELTANQATLQPAADGDEFVSEIAVVRVSDQAAPTTVTLRDPVQNLLDMTTVTVYANIVFATHGQTIDQEILGSTDAASLRQRFVLKRAPLTYVPAANARGYDSTLNIQVNGVTWQAVPTLYDRDGSDRTYLLRHEADGSAVVIFGDGQHGARLPSGAEHITATYRMGGGEAGNLPPGSLTMLRTRPPGLQKVINPLPASGGTEPESIDHARFNAPQKIRTLQRLVSLQDYEDFARSFGGIGQAQARLIWAGRARRLHLTIAGESGAAVTPESSLYTDLLTAINRLCASHTEAIQVDSYQPLYFNVQARLVLELDRLAAADRVVAAARLQLADAFAFDQRLLAQAVSASEIIAILQNVPGVNAVLLDQLYRVGEPATLNPRLEAYPARWFNGQILPSELVMIDSANASGIDLTVFSPEAVA